MSMDRSDWKNPEIGAYCAEQAKRGGEPFVAQLVNEAHARLVGSGVFAGMELPGELRCFWLNEGEDKRERYDLVVRVKGKDGWIDAARVEVEHCTLPEWDNRFPKRWDLHVLARKVVLDKPNKWDIFVKISASKRGFFAVNSHWLVGGITAGFITYKELRGDQGIPGLEGDATNNEVYAIPFSFTNNFGPMFQLVPSYFISDVGHRIDDISRMIHKHVWHLLRTGNQYRPEFGKMEAV